MSIPNSLDLLRMAMTVLKTYLFLQLMVDLQEGMTRDEITLPKTKSQTGHLKQTHCISAWQSDFNHPFEWKDTAA